MGGGEARRGRAGVREHVLDRHMGVAELWAAYGWRPVPSELPTMWLAARGAAQDAAAAGAARPLPRGQGPRAVRMPSGSGSDPFRFTPVHTH